MCSALTNAAHDTAWYVPSSVMCCSLALYTAPDCSNSTPTAHARLQASSWLQTFRVHTLALFIFSMRSSCVRALRVCRQRRRHAPTTTWHSRFRTRLQKLVRCWASVSHARMCTLHGYAAGSFSSSKLGCLAAHACTSNHMSRSVELRANCAGSQLRTHMSWASTHHKPCWIPAP
jgi:hypothetical protein